MAFRNHYGWKKPNQKERMRRRARREAMAAVEQRRFETELAQIEEMCPPDRKIIMPGDKKARPRLLVRQGFDGKIIKVKSGGK